MPIFFGSICHSAACALWFARTVTEPARFSKGLDLAVWSLIFALLSAVALDTALTSRTSLALLMGLTVLALVAIWFLKGVRELMTEHVEATVEKDEVVEKSIV